jgi:hypothetical protein
MSISKDLFMSILSMDAYNRGYGAGIDPDGDGNGLGVEGRSIGNATILDIDLPTTSQNEGFYAVAYTLEEAVGEGTDQIADGTTIISYRGTEGMRKGWSGLYH